MVSKRQSRLGLALVLISALLSSLAFVAAVASPKPDPSRSEAQSIDVAATPILHFDRTRPGLKRFGKLEFRGGLGLSSPNANFGGWSGLTIDSDGRKLLAVSDAGAWLIAELTYDGVRPKGLGLARIGPILGAGGRAIARDRERDSEAVALVDGTISRGTVLVAFERSHRIIRYPVSDKGLGVPIGVMPMPPDIRRMSPNRGLESLCQLQGRLKGTIVAFSERFPSRSGDHVGWMLAAGSQSWTTLTLKNVGGFDLVDCAGLPDGGLLLLERRFRWSEVLSGVRSNIRRIRPEELKAGHVIQGEFLLEADGGHEIDNLEGIATHVGPGGEVVITLVSDDNFSSWMQRTILLQFALTPEAPARKAGQ